jgi:chromosome partitioning protein
VVITFLNTKGGVGKTSACFHLSGTLARMGYRVLGVDADPQSSLTSGFFGPAEMEQIAPEESIAAIHAGDDPFPATVIRPTGFPGIDLIPGSEAAARFNARLPEDASPDEQLGLRNFLEGISGQYDVVLIDPPPNLYCASWSALVASDAIVVPLQAEDFGSQGLRPVRAIVEAVQGGVNPDLKLAGYLLTMFDKRLSVHVAYESQLRAMFGEAVFETTFPLAKDFKSAVCARKPIAFAQKSARNAAVKATQAVADELLRRVGLVDAQDTERGAA